MTVLRLKCNIVGTLQELKKKEKNTSKYVEAFKEDQSKKYLHSNSSVADNDVCMTLRLQDQI